MARILIPAIDAEEWKRFLAEPDKQWKKGFSARALAYCWQDSEGLPSNVQSVFAKSTFEVFKNFELLLAIPEHQVPLPGGSRPSQSDIWVLGRGKGELVSIAVEGKVSEPFGPTIREWLQDESSGKKDRLYFLLNKLGLPAQIDETIRYQLLHRTASAIIEAHRFNAIHAMMLVHSFSQTEEWLEDYDRFVSLFGGKAIVNSITSVGKRNGISLYFGWVRGEKRYLNS